MTRRRRDSSAETRNAGAEARPDPSGEAFHDRSEPGPGTAPVVDAAESGGLPRYARVDEVGRGGAGVVHHYHDRLLGRSLAVKELAVLADAGRVRRALREAQCMAALDHPNVVPIYDLDLGDDGLPRAIRMKLVRGRSIEAWVADEGAIAAGGQVERYCEALLGVCDALTHAHATGILHCDLKPRNVMVGALGEVYVVDWGLARRIDDARISHEETEDPRGRPWAPVGTPRFMAPEQARGRPEDPRTDVFGVGALLYFMLTGRPPLDGTNAWQVLSASIQGRIGALDDEDGALPPGLCRIARRALALEPEDRYPSITALRDELAGFLRGGGWLPVRSYAGGEAIVRQGEPSDAAYVIESGRCVVVQAAAGRTRTLRTMSAGETFGELGVFTRRPRTASVFALDDVIVRVVTSASLDRELERNPWIASFVRTLARRFVALETRDRADGNEDV